MRQWTRLFLLWKDLKMKGSYVRQNLHGPFGINCKSRRGRYSPCTALCLQHMRYYSCFSKRHRCFVATSFTLPTHLWMMLRPAAKRKYLNIKAVCDNLPSGSVAALLPLHALTGCDTTSVICNHPRKSRRTIK